MENGEQFEIALSDITMKVTCHIIENDEVFHIVFSDGRPDLVLHEAISGGLPFWTSIPQAKHRLAETEFFGARIAEHFKK
jgi:hypothetical protein